MVEEGPQPAGTSAEEARPGWTGEPAARCVWCRRKSVGLAARHWFRLGIYGAPVGATGPRGDGLELTGEVLLCSWPCLALFAAEAGDMR